MPGSTRVLAVDDDRVHLYAIDRRLRSVGFQVKSVASGQIALDEARSGNYDVVLLDVNIPDLNGFDICAAIRGDSRLAQPAIVFHSATYSSEENFVRARQLGADAFLTYPLDSEALTAVLLHVVKARRNNAERLVLTCWKDIARFFNKGVRTVQRWESLGMPVHRPQQDKSIVFADPEELKRWAFANPKVLHAFEGTDTAAGSSD